MFYPKNKQLVFVLLACFGVSAQADQMVDGVQSILGEHLSQIFDNNGGLRTNTNVLTVKDSKQAPQYTLALNKQELRNEYLRRFDHKEAGESTFWTSGVSDYYKSDGYGVFLASYLLSFIGGLIAYAAIKSWLTTLIVIATPAVLLLGLIPLGILLATARRHKTTWNPMTQDEKEKLAKVVNSQPDVLEYVNTTESTTTESPL